MANEQIVNDPSLYVDNLELAYVDGTTFTVESGAARDSGNNYDLTLDAQTTVDFGVNGINGLDTGSIAATSWYYVFLIGDAAKFKPTGLLVSLSATPLLPFGYSPIRRIGWILTTGGSVIRGWYGTGNAKTRHYEWNTVVSALAAGAATTFAAVDVGVGAPPQEGRVYFKTSYTPAIAANAADIRVLGSGGAAGATPIGMLGIVATVVQVENGVNSIATLSSGSPTIQYQVTASDALDIDVSGYDDFI